MSEADPLPNVVCHECWTTTEAFHELYEKSKIVQEKFLNSLVKIEPDPVEQTADNQECNINSADNDPIKMEISLGK